MVEAAMVLPIIILIVLSLILLMIYVYACLNTQVKSHQQLIIEADHSSQMFTIKKNKQETSTHLGGFVSLIMNKEIESRAYVMHQAKIIRLGEMLDGD
ncbi:uncharacterized protein YpmS [Clostridiales Family XIII bacterium PM5-7]